jgi:hypothetical protein
MLSASGRKENGRTDVFPETRMALIKAIGAEREHFGGKEGRKFEFRVFFQRAL